MGTVAARRNARKAFMTGDDIDSSHRPCNTSANCVLDQRPQFVFGDLLEGFLALVELPFAAADFSLPAANLFEPLLGGGIMPILEPLFFAIQLRFLLGHRTLLGVEGPLLGEKCG